MVTGCADSRQDRARWVGAPSSRDPGVLLPAEVDRLRRSGTTRFAEAGTVVVASGTPVRQVHVVASGEIGLMTRLEGGRVTMAVVRTGGVVGDIPLLLGQPMPFDAVARRT